MRSKKSASTTASQGHGRVRVGELGDRIAPAVEEARTRITPIVEDARTRIAPMVDDARERLTPVVDDARLRLAPVVDDARVRLAPVVDDARVRLADLTEAVATRLDETLPDKATPAAVKAASAHSKKRGGTVRKLVLVGGLGGLLAFVVSKLRGGI